ncbi:hypothetical protein SAMN05216351_11927 [Pseudobutyrivibrio sp. JW11]|uniref:hypothetical protein n=1 Tax=Pseudobutyrivibrio sp. JW11 TaxID=1855302 RepID=UPI0008E311A9|nr:hypothetical protein [Pseudobutyrivibrio sp. JW11]SFO61707.1 hypothetical protein SAMN05216351_11927 [Pseudobutyrivibrio sp. JW11]
MRKRLFVFTLCVTIAASMIACGKDNVSGEVEPEELADALDESKSESEATENKDDSANSESENLPTIEVVEGYNYSDEYNAAFELDDRVGANYRASGASEVSEFASWKEGYKALVEDLSSEDSVSFSLIYVDSDDVPELIYKVDDSDIVIATFTGSTVNLLSGQIDSVSYVEGDNVLLATEHVDANTYNSVVAIKDGYWINIAYCTQGPLDPWAEDSFDENGNAIISYWEINGEELASQDEYDELFGKYYDSSFGKEITEFNADASQILEQIEAL